MNDEQQKDIPMREFLINAAAARRLLEIALMPAEQLECIDDGDDDHGVLNWQSEQTPCLC